MSAPRPGCPPVRRITATKDEEENAMEYGLPSSHTLNTICLSGYTALSPLRPKYIFIVHVFDSPRVLFKRLGDA